MLFVVFLFVELLCFIVQWRVGVGFGEVSLAPALHVIWQLYVQSLLAGNGLRIGHVHDKNFNELIYYRRHGGCESKLSARDDLP